MEYIFILIPSEKSIILDLITDFKKCSKEVLVSYYNRAVEIGIVGSRGQAQRLIALNVAFHKHFSKSPIKIENNILINLTDKIELLVIIGGMKKIKIFLARLPISKSINSILNNCNLKKHLFFL